MDNEYSIAYYSKPHTFTVDIIQFVIHTHTHKLWAPQISAEVNITKLKDQGKYSKSCLYKNKMLVF